MEFLIYAVMVLATILLAITMARAMNRDMARAEASSRNMDRIAEIGTRVREIQSESGKIAKQADDKCEEARTIAADPKCAPNVFEHLAKLKVIHDDVVELSKKHKDLLKEAEGLCDEMRRINYPGKS